MHFYQELKNRLFRCSVLIAEVRWDLVRGASTPQGVESQSFIAQYNRLGLGSGIK